MPRQEAFLTTLASIMFNRATAGTHRRSQIPSIFGGRRRSKRWGGSGSGKPTAAVNSAANDGRHNANETTCHGSGLAYDHKVALGPARVVLQVKRPRHPFKNSRGFASAASGFILSLGDRGHSKRHEPDSRREPQGEFWNRCMRA
jgi:hypothetical protein